MVYTRNFFPDTLIHPGLTLIETLEAIRMTQKELSIRADISEKQISGIINGDFGITSETALKLERVLGVPASFWNNLEKAHQEDKARITEQKLIESEKDQVKNYPYSKLYELGFVPDTKNSAERYINLLNFFWSTSLSVLTEISSFRFALLGVAFRKSEKSIISSEALLSWLRCWEIRAKDVEVWEFNRTGLKEALPRLKGLTLAEVVDLNAIKAILSSVWVKFAFIPGFPKSPVFGVTRKIGWYPFIQMSDRYQKTDIFWFSFFHEIAHILLHLHKKDDVFINIENKEEIEEQEANEWASDFLLDKQGLQELTKQLPIKITQIKEFAQKNWVWVCIVAWRLGYQFKDQNPWKDLSDLRTKLLVIDQ